MNDDNSLTTIFPDNPPEWLFWWESNQLLGWVASPEDWKKVKATYPDLDTHRVRQASRDHAAVVMHAPASRSFGLCREHDGEKTLADHAAEYGLEWLK